MVKISAPVHGAVLNHRHGSLLDGGLKITVCGHAPVRDAVRVNGVPARRAGERFEVEIVLRNHQNPITATGVGSGGESAHTVRVVWDRQSRPRYRFAIDDNIFFLRDLVARGCPSLFDSFYLAILRDLHRRYGAKFVLNLFHATPENDFTLSQVPDRYRNEWADNADWLKLSFHAFSEFPDRPYQYATAEKLGKDFDQVRAEIERFAGEPAWSTPTVIHWGMVHPSALPALTERGVKVLSGMFVPDRGSRHVADDLAAPETAETGYDVNYGLDDVRSAYLHHHDALLDFRTGIVFSRVDIICNNTPVANVVPTLEPLTRDPATAEIMDLFTHEQYFWPFYPNHRPDHAQRCEAAIRFCNERGYAPVFFHEGFLGGPE